MVLFFFLIISLRTIIALVQQNNSQATGLTNQANLPTTLSIHTHTHQAEPCRA